MEDAEDFARLAEQLLTEKQERPTLERIIRSAVRTLDLCDVCAQHEQSTCHTGLRAAS